MPSLPSRDRAISPVIGVALLVVLVLLLSVVTAVMVFGLAEEREPAPELSMSLDDSQGSIEHRLVYEQGQRLDGDRVEVRGVADPETLSGTALIAGDSHAVVPIAGTIEVVWFGTDGTSYIVWEASVDPAFDVPSADVGCSWVANESNDGVDPVKVSGTVVDCDVTTDDKIEVYDDGAVIGDVTSDDKLLDADDARVFGSVDVAKDANLQDGLISGSVTARTEGAKIDNGTVGGSVTAERTVEVVAGSTVGGDAESETKPVKVLSSEVSGDVASDDSVKLQDATVSGDVYVDGTFDCTNSTVNGQDCGAYSPKDYDDD